MELCRAAAEARSITALVSAVPQIVPKRLKWNGLSSLATQIYRRKSFHFVRHNTPESKWNSFEQLTSCKYKPYRDKSFHLPATDPSSDTTLDMGPVVMIFQRIPTPDCCPGVGQNVGQAKCKKTHTILPFVPPSAELRNTAPVKKKMTLFPPPNCQRTSGFMDRMVSPTHHSPLTTHNYFAISSRMLSRVLFVK